MKSFLFVGPLVAVGTVLTVSSFSGYEHLLWLSGFIFSYRIFQDYVLSPYLMSEGVEVSPLLVIIGLLAGDELGGVAGIFLSVPVLATLKIVFVRVKSVSAYDAAGETNSRMIESVKPRSCAVEAPPQHPYPGRLLMSAI
ncbi:AI-2E family transporter [Undibacterium arcticum]